MIEPPLLRLSCLRLCCLGIALLPLRATLADELRLDDGRVLVGKVVERGDTYEVTTYEGVVVVQKGKVLARRTDNELRTALAADARNAGSSPFAHLQLAIRARSYGLTAELWRYLDQAVSGIGPRPTTQLSTTATAVSTQDRDGQLVREGQSEALHRRLDDFLAQLEPEVLGRKWRNAATSARVHQLLDRLRPDTSRGRAAAIETLLVREQNADQDLRTEARRNGSERQRIGALGALQRRGLAGNDHFVLRTAILDGNADVRLAAVGIARGHDDAAAVAYLAPGLMHSSSRVRVRTAEAFAEIGHHDAVKLLVLAGPNAGLALGAADQGIRAHVAFLNQQAYIRDYDVEVAQAAFIADPKVDTLQSGAVLDVTVQGVYEEVVIVRAYQKALKQLAKDDPGQNPRVWATWLANLPQAPAATTAPR